jgi:hypothetical protein
VWLGALRRFTIALAIVTAGAALLGLVAGAVIKQGLRRDLAVGFYLAGMGLLSLALLLGTRPPVKFREGRGDSSVPGGFFDRGVRWASREEQDEAINVPALFATLGVCLLVFGALCDPSRKLV